MRTAAAVLVLVIAGWSLRELSAGELDDVRRSVRDGDEDPSSGRDSAEKRREKSRRSSDHKCPDDEDTPFLSRMFFFCCAAPFQGPHALLGDDLADIGQMVSRPYVEAPAGLLTDADPATRLPPLSGRLQLDVLSDFDDLDRFGGSLLVETPFRLGVDTSGSVWNEAGTGDGALCMGDFNLVYRFAQSERVQFRSGVGLNWLSDDAGAELGFNFTYGAEVYPSRPWVLGTTFDLGTLGDAGLFHCQATAGVVFDRWDVFVGVDYSRIGQGELSGLLSGVRFRF